MYSELNGARNEIQQQKESKLPRSAAPGHVFLFTHKESVMNTLSTALKQFVNDEDGVTAIEYGMIAALIATALVAGVGVVAGGLENAFDYIAGKMTVGP
ncbi:Flp family type IVb pilin [Massilia sp. GCM10020059]|nr:Flp family type IVb pilin [Massilia agrisoli]